MSKAAGTIVDEILIANPACVSIAFPLPFGNDFAQFSK
jgi:hypothetical protein